jgi:Family of unknown function (DUF6171)
MNQPDGGRLFPEEYENMTAKIFTSRPDPKEVGEPPPLPDLMRNFYHEMRDWAQDGFNTENEVEINRRLNICQGCESFKEGRCMLCGCFMKLKARLSTGSCPSGKW